MSPINKFDFISSQSSKTALAPNSDTVDKYNLFKLVVLSLSVPKLEPAQYQSLYEYFEKNYKSGFRGLLPSGSSAVVLFRTAKSAKNFLDGGHSRTPFVSFICPATKPQLSRLIKPYESHKHQTSTDLFDTVCSYASAFHLEGENSLKSFNKESETIVSCTQPTPIAHDSVTRVSVQFQVLSLEEIVHPSKEVVAGSRKVSKGKFEEDEEVEWWVKGKFEDDDEVGWWINRGC